MNSSSVITKKGLIVGLLFVIINAYWVGIASELWYSVFTLVSPFSNAIFSLVFLIAVNALLRKWVPGLALTSAELLLVYVMATMVSTISGHAMMCVLMGALTHPFWFASPENEWQQLFWRYIPSWFTVRDTTMLKYYFEGESSIFVMEYLRVWLVPVFVWSGFILALYGSLLCIGLILRKRWMEQEKLSFPLTQLPVQMTMGKGFFRSRVMWVGLGIAAFIRLVNGFHDLFPALPAFPHGYRLDRFFTERPWSAIGYTNMSFNLAIVGLTYFMPLDLSFSCWFFFWLTRAERMLADIIGWKHLHLNDRAAGAWVGIALLALWTSRRHLARFVRQVLAHKAGNYDQGEPLSYRATAILTAVSILLVALFCVTAGMSLWVLVVFYALYLAFALSIGRVRAELGPPYHEVIGINPRQMMVEIFGTRRLGGANLTIITFLYAFNRCNRSHPMPNQLESLKIGERSGMSGRWLFGGMVLAIGVGAVATILSYLHIAYYYGTLARCRGWIGSCGWESFNPLQNWLQYPRNTDGRGIGFMFGGMGFVYFLYLMRTRFLWWPLHASGYVLSGASWGGMIYFWFPVMVSWLLKALILKFGGLRSFRRLAPLFLGLVLGDYIPRSIWSLVSLVLNVYMPASGAGHTL